MKKILCLLLAVMMLFGLCGCVGDSEPEDVRGDVISGNQNEKEDEDDDIVDEIPSQDETEAETETGAEPEPGFSLGSTTNNFYNNDFLGLSCTLPAGWVFYTDDQILEMNNIASDVMDEDVAAQLENATIIYDMFAAYQEEGSNVNINLEKFTAAQWLSLDIKQALESQIDAIKSTYQNMGYIDTEVVYQEVEVDGRKFDGLKITAKIQGVDFYGSCFAFKKGNYLANVTICSLQTDKTDTILSYFTVE